MTFDDVWLRENRRVDFYPNVKNRMQLTEGGMEAEPYSKSAVEFDREEKQGNERACVSVYSRSRKISYRLGKTYLQ